MLATSGRSVRKNSLVSFYSGDFTVPAGIKWSILFFISSHLVRFDPQFSLSWPNRFIYYLVESTGNYSTSNGETKTPWAHQSDTSFWCSWKKCSSWQFTLKFYLFWHENAAGLNKQKRATRVGWRQNETRDGLVSEDNNSRTIKISWGVNGPIFSKLLSPQITCEKVPQTTSCSPPVGVKQPCRPAAASGFTHLELKYSNISVGSVWVRFTLVTNQLPLQMNSSQLLGKSSSLLRWRAAGNRLPVKKDKDFVHTVPEILSHFGEMSGSSSPASTNTCWTFFSLKDGLVPYKAAGFQFPRHRCA